MTEQNDIRERNLRAVEALYESERTRDLSAWVPLWHPDGRQTFRSLPTPRWSASTGSPR